MADFSVCHGGWIAVCDGSKAMLLENKGDRFNPKLEMLEVAGQENPPTRSQGSSPPGRTISSADGRRAAMEETDFHAQAERCFFTPLPPT